VIESAAFGAEISDLKIEQRRYLPRNHEDLSGKHRSFFAPLGFGFAIAFLQSPPCGFARSNVVSSLVTAKFPLKTAIQFIFGYGISIAFGCA
jgi:hypothetical protein